MFPESCYHNIIFSTIHLSSCLTESPVMLFAWACIDDACYHNTEYFQTSVSKVGVLMFPASCSSLSVGQISVSYAALKLLLITFSTRWSMLHPLFHCIPVRRPLSLKTLTYHVIPSLFPCLDHWVVTEIIAIKNEVKDIMKWHTDAASSNNHSSYRTGPGGHTGHIIQLKVQIFMLLHVCASVTLCKAAGSQLT